MSSDKMQIGDRMKRYESVSSACLTNRSPVIIRVDGRAFHTYTRDFYRPFDSLLQTTMVEAAKQVAGEMQGFEVAYHQSDEVSFLLTDYDKITTSAWFDYTTQKITTITASVMTAWFNRLMKFKMDAIISDALDKETRQKYLKIIDRIAYFDARAFNVPKEDVVNYFLWRAKDWERNSLQMYCMSFFSPRQLEGKGAAERHEMLHSIGKNWATDVEPKFRNGTFILSDDKPRINSDGKPSNFIKIRGFKENPMVQARYYQIEKLVGPLVYKDQYVPAPVDIAAVEQEIEK